MLIFFYKRYVHINYKIQKFTTRTYVENKKNADALKRQLNQAESQ